MHEARVGLPGLGATERADRWWIGPLATGVALAIFVAYSVYVVLAGNNFRYGPYISPFYSPYIGVPGVSAAMLVAWVPGLFRLSCYYYRKAYYRAYFLSPPACAVSEPNRKYTGEDRAPLAWFSIGHRWLLYLALVVLVFLWIDAVRAFNFDGQFGIGLGSLILLGNVVLLSGFTLGCHALRSLVGGNMRCFSCSAFGEMRYGMWRGVTFFNAKHMVWAWISLFSVAFADLYVRLCAAGVFADPRLF
ncbi:MAG: succinate dehydrogenase [Candidatus Eremiobacteraeota bacterium]|nr:succinate dehydrogenase [Candidatus Eremiobacteraeota bacterium]